MSNRRGGAGGRKARATSNKHPQKGGSNSAGNSLPNGQMARDNRHNWDLPCCHLLEEYTQELWGIEKEVTSSRTEAGADAAAGTGSAKRGPLSPKFFLVQMMRNHFLEQQRRRKLEDSTTTAKSTTPNKKKKKKKKKKASKASVGAATTADEKGETDESDSIAISSTLSQDSQSISKDESNNTTTASVAATASATQPAANSKMQASATTTDEDDSGEGATTVIARKTPVDTYLDRFTEAAEKKKQSDDAAISDNSSPPGRDLDAFVRYLNDKYGSSGCGGKTASNKKSNKISSGPSPSVGLSISKEDLEAACESIVCSDCRAAAVTSLRQDFGSLQPVVLSPITFGGNGMDSSNPLFSGRDDSGNQTPPRNPHGSNNNNHNGLAIPIHNQKTGQTVPPPPPSVDFDYVALEEGINPMGTLMKIKADLAGTPYFHPQLVPAANSSSTGGSGKKQPLTSKGTGEEALPTQLEWRFVSSSSSQSPTQTADKGTELQEGMSATDEVFVTARDLELLAKDLMLPLGLKPDDLVGANTELSEDDLQLVFEKTKKTDSDTRNNIYDSKDKELQKNYVALNKAENLDDNGEGSNMQIQSPPTYLDLDKSLQHALEEVTKDIIWDRILYLHPKLNQSVVQTSPSWHSASAYLMDACTTAIVEDLECMSEYERCLGELANAQGRIPQMFESRAHRKCFRAMIHGRLDLINRLLTTAQRASMSMEDAWFSPSDDCSNPPVGLSGIPLPFCMKWYAEQEFCLQLQKRQKRKAWGPGTQVSNEPEDIAANKSFQISKHAPVSGPQEWVGKIDFHAEDLLTSLLDLTKRVEKGRIDEIREEHNCRCIKVLGVLTKVGQEIFAPLGNDAKGSSDSVRLDDEATRENCRALWAQIQDHKNQQARQEFLNEEGGPNMFEQKRTVAALMQLSIRMLRKIRKCVTDKHEPANAPPLMPLSLVSKLAEEAKTSESYGHVNPETVGDSYHSLMGVTCFCRGVERCRGGSGQRRFKSLVLTLFFQKLSENCSEWHAALAEEELLTAMKSEDFGLDTGSIGGENTGASGSAASSKTSKKPKKKKAKKTTVVADPAKELDDVPTNQQESGQEASKNGILSSNQDEATDLPIGVGKASDALKGHETPKEERTKKTPKDSKSEAANNSETAGNGASMPQKSQKGGKNKGAPTVSSTVSNAVDLSTEDVDSKMGVSNKSGSIQTAESFLVGRLTTLLAQSPKHGGLGKARGGDALVVMIQ